MEDVRVSGSDPNINGEDDEYWNEFEDLGAIALTDGEEDEPEDLQSQKEKQFGALIEIKHVLCISIMTHSTNQRCNTFQSAVGIFLHSCNTPETIQELLAHMGVLVSMTTINQAVTSLSKEAKTAMRTLGKTFMTLYAYDNLDIDLKHSVETIEKPQDTLIHITTGTLIPLHPDVKLADLECSEELWRKCRNNLYAQPVEVSLEQLMNLPIYKESEHPTNLTCRGRFNAWKYMEDLVECRPSYFQKFRKELKQPEVVEQIPLVKSTQTPLNAYDISPNNALNNAQVLDDFFQQTAISDSDGVQNVGDRVILIFGDLLTGQHIRSILESRAQEETPWLWMQFIVYVFGLFHLKMACADAMWRVFIQKAKPMDTDTNSLMAHVSQIRPKETGKILSKPGFRRMHEVIQHVGIVSRLDRLRLEAEKSNLAHKSLDDWAASKPSWEMITEMATCTIKQNEAQSQLHRICTRPTSERDKQRENMILREEYFLLYEEMSHALNYGDIGRVEVGFLPWIYIFLGCGKHKYATKMRRYLENVHFVYPKGLSQAIRTNILCNPTGHEGCFRAIDWVVEHNNLYTKRIYGGKYSNHQKVRILKESPLLEVYKNTRIQFEKMFCLEHKTTRHSPPKMQLTFKKLGEYMRKEVTNSYIAGRTANEIANVMANGMHQMMTGSEAGDGAKGDADDEQEVEDDGSLDI